MIKSDKNKVFGFLAPSDFSTSASFNGIALVFYWINNDTNLVTGTSGYRLLWSYDKDRLFNLGTMKCTIKIDRSQDDYNILLGDWKNIKQDASRYP